MNLSLKKLYLPIIIGIIPILLAPRSLRADDTLPTNDEWQSSRPMLEKARPLEPHRQVPFLKAVQAAIVRTFSNLDHAKEMAKIQQEQAAPLASRGKGILVPLSMSSTTEKETQISKSLTKTLKTFAQKEGSTDLLPDSYRLGLNFGFGGPSHTGLKASPKPNYRLIVTNIEPDSKSMKLASLNSNDYELLPYAGKANLEYDVGLVYEDSSAPIYRTQIRPTNSSLWDTIYESPSLRFNGRITPKGFLTDGKLSPVQVLTLEQVDGYYAYEAEMQSSIAPKTAVHRLRVPILGGAKYGEDWNQDFKKVKSSIERIYASGPFSLNLERYELENRYQTGIIYKASTTQVEIYTFIPDSSLLESPEFSGLTT